MDSLSKQQKRAIWMGLFGLILILLGIKVSLQYFTIGAVAVDSNDQPVLIFFSLDDSCECMRQMIYAADFQIAHWSEEARMGIAVYRYDFDQNRQLANQYEVFRVPSLLLLDEKGRIVSRQDYPILQNGPLDLNEFETVIQSLVDQRSE
jgi:hypothetical protein